MIDNRKIQLQKWFEINVGFVVTELETVSGDASFRRYFRVNSKDSSYILVDAPPATEKNREFIEFSHQYAQVGLDVPRVLFSDCELGFLCLTDLGRQTLLPLVKQAAEYWYPRAISLLPLVAKVAVTNPDARYDAKFFQLEIDLFVDWFCCEFLDISPSSINNNDMNAIFKLLIESALAQPQISTHRDFHTRNLMVRDTHTLAVIDFQDTVIGPITYDVASLLKDCYFKLDNEQRDKLLLISYQQFKKLDMLHTSFEQYQQWFDFMGLQRHLKVCGIFSRLHLRDKKSAYLDDLPLVIEYIVQVCEKYPQLTPLKQLFEDVVIPRLAHRIS